MKVFLTNLLPPGWKLMVLTQGCRLALLAWMVLSPASSFATSIQLGSSTNLEGPAAGIDSVMMTISPTNGTWSATANDTWLHLSATNQSGTGGATIGFTFDANSGATRIGTLIIGGQTFTVTQAGAGYVVANPLVTLVVSNASTSLSHPAGVAVDDQGNIYFSSQQSQSQVASIEKWSIASNSVTTLISSNASYPLAYPEGVAVDDNQNVYFTESSSGSALYKWTATNSQVSALYSGAYLRGIALDGAGNVYVADDAQQAVYEWVATNGNVNLLFQDYPNNTTSRRGVAVDIAGNVYIADDRNNGIWKWTAASGLVAPLVYLSVASLTDVVVDGGGNLYCSDSSGSFGAGSIHKITAANNNLSILFASALSQHPDLNEPYALARDAGGNIYIADFANNAIKELVQALVDTTPITVPVIASSATLPPVLPVTENLQAPFAPTSDQSWLTITGVTNGVVSFSCTFNPGFSNRTAHITVLGQAIPITQPGPILTLSTNTLVEGPSAGADAVTLTVSPTNLTWTAQANASWLHLSATNQSGNGNATVVFTFDANPGVVRTGTLTIGSQTLTVTQQNPTFLGAPALLEGPGAGNDSVVLAVNPATPNWTATANVFWLHINAATLSGTGNTNVIFSYDANSGTTRTGTLTIAGQTLTVTQAGATYQAVTTPLTNAAGLSTPRGVAVDGQGNVYVVSGGINGIQQFSPGGNPPATLISGLNNPYGVAVDNNTNIYLAIPGNGAIEEWSITNQSLNPLATDLINPFGVTLDGGGAVYFTDSGNSAIKELAMPGSAVNTLVSSNASTPLYFPFGVAVDAAENIYIADTYNNQVKKLAAGTTNPITLVAAGLNSPQGLAVDGSGNIYIADNANNAIKKWSAVSGTVTTLTSGLLLPFGVAVDGAGNVYFSDTGHNLLMKLPRAYVDATPILETNAAGNDVLPVVLPASVNLLTPFVPTSDQSWLTITGVTNGVVSFAFAANTNSTNRTAHITVLRQTIPITQPGSFLILSTNTLVEGSSAGMDAVVLTVSPANLTWTAQANASWLHLSATNQSGAGNATVVFTFDANPGAVRTGTLTIGGQTLTITQQNLTRLGVPALLEGPGAGNDSVVLAIGPATPSWTATANVSWLHISAATQSGISNTNVIFSYDANLGATRTGTLTIGGQTLTVTQAGSTYQAVTTSLTNAAGLSTPRGVAVDGQGNIYDVAAGFNGVQQWSLGADSNHSVILVFGLNNPYGVAVDNNTNVYVAVTGGGSIQKWSITNQSLSSLATGLINPFGVALDGNGAVYFTDSGHSAIKELAAPGSAVTTLVSSNASTPLYFPFGVTLDISGNLYIADTYNNQIKKLAAGTTNPITLVAAGLNSPQGLAVDGSGNIYIADNANNAIKKWSAVSNTVTTLASGLLLPFGVAVDGAGNVYFSDTGHNLLMKLPRAYVDATPIMETNAAGNDVLPVVLPTSVNLLTPFVPTSDQSWLTITGVTNGVVSFAFAANTNPTNRTAHITVLRQTIPITQPGSPKIMVFNGINAITNGQTTPVNFGSGLQNQTGTSLTFTVTNSGAQTLNVGALAVPAGFAVITNLPASIPAGGKASFSVQLVTTLTGTNAGNITFTNNDPNNHSFSFAVTGIVNPPPLTAAPLTVTALAGQNLIIALANVAANWSDADGATITLAGINLTTTNGVRLATNSTVIFYPAKVSVNDQISYTITDNYAGVATGLINIVVNPNGVSGQVGSLTVSGGTATVNFAGIPGYTYYVQRTTVLTGPWTDVATNIAPSNGLFHFIDGNPPGASAYYRLSTAP